MDGFDFDLNITADKLTTEDLTVDNATLESMGTRTNTLFVAGVSTGIVAGGLGLGAWLVGER